MTKQAELAIEHRTLLRTIRLRKIAPLACVEIIFSLRDQVITLD